MSRPVPEGALPLSFDDALAYHLSWTPEDRQIARSEIEGRFGDPPLGDPEGLVTWQRLAYYVPPSGGYVAAHLGRGDSPVATNVFYLHAGLGWPIGQQFLPTPGKCRGYARNVRTPA